MTAAPSPWEPVLKTLWSQSRFASFFFQAVSFVPNDDLPTLALTAFQRRLTLFYNAAFVEQTRPEHLIGLLIHEMLHVIFNHDHRLIPGRNLHVQNLAQDMVINSYVWENRKTFFSRTGRHQTPELKLPPGLPMIPRSFSRDTGKTDLAQVSWEEVYVWLNSRSAFPDTSQREEDPGLPGMDQSFWQALGDKDAHQDSMDGLSLVDQGGNPLPTGAHLFGDATANEQANAGAKRVLRFIRQGGECSNERALQDLACLIEAPAKVKRPVWRREIKTILDYSRPREQWEYASSRFNRRYVDAGIYAPGRRYTHMPLITVVVDVSGSMASHPKEMEQAFGLVESLVSDFRINLLCLDQDLFIPQKQGEGFKASKSKRPYYYKKGDWRYIRSGSRGTTLFAPLFNAYMSGHKEALLVLTDGFIYDLKALKPHHPTIWAVPSAQEVRFHPPFGRVVSMGDAP
ncbi:conserved hypothetical protein [Desulfatibacillum aliphaticivorans]|uniref:Putative metallopeptidase domain-containing protein n=1 Tax=Desulfatibacillum aliphaticivorans TaxID=218208 RepID=B8FGP7_DESAL|nr:hypothetical protein [Desulfatibacillum aliphaticivorans]ACL05277.1 conserved hypothetical protein [Desulfatibacillum aliphaticivorans]